MSKQRQRPGPNYYRFDPNTNIEYIGRQVRKDHPAQQAVNELIRRANEMGAGLTPITVVTGTVTILRPDGSKQPYDNALHDIHGDNVIFIPDNLLSHPHLWARLAHEIGHYFIKHRPPFLENLDPERVDDIYRDLGVDPRTPYLQWSDEAKSKYEEHRADITAAVLVGPKAALAWLETKDGSYSKTHPRPSNRAEMVEDYFEWFRFEAPENVKNFWREPLLPNDRPALTADASPTNKTYALNDLSPPPTPGQKDFKTPGNEKA